jgi:hypothetical protein
MGYWGGLPVLKIVWSFVKFRYWVFTRMLIHAASESLEKNSPTCLLAVRRDWPPSVERRHPIARLMRETFSGNLRMLGWPDDLTFWGEGPGPFGCVFGSGVESGSFIATDSQ